MDGPERYAVVSCHVERPVDDVVWRAFERLLARRPGGFVVTPFLRPPDAASGEHAERWLERARRCAELAPLGHHTHWGGPSRARPYAASEAAGLVEAEIAWLRERGLKPGYFCGGGWFLDVPVAEALAAAGYVDCTATTFRQRYLADDAPALRVEGPRRLRLPSGALLQELPATHSLGMLARSLVRLPPRVHLHFHDWELVDRRRAAALDVTLRLLGRLRPRLTIEELARESRAAAEVAWQGGTIAS